MSDPAVHIDHIGRRDVEVMQVVRTTLTRAGAGTDANPYRRVTQYWTMDGDLLAEVDPERPPTKDFGHALADMVAANMVSGPSPRR